jgi:3-methyladenine DNA glycosylase/8-oxoguanine DNA glycosylase
VGQQAETALAGGGAVGDGVIGSLPPGSALPRAGAVDLGTLPAGFDLHRVALSHGWSGLDPTAYDAATGVLHRTLVLPDAGPVTMSVSSPSAGRLEASWAGTALTDGDRRAAVADLRRVLVVDDDLADLGHAARAAAAELPGVAAQVAAGGGRLLRSPTVWEDLVKTLATTNCSWALTRGIVSRLVAWQGEAAPGGERAFPSPDAVAAVEESDLAREVRAGYRSGPLVALAGNVAAGRLDPEAWRDPALADEEVLDAVLALRGFGPYAAQGMLGLLGRPRGLALDSWVRAKLPRLLGRERMTDAEIARRYEPLGCWAGTGLWLELTADWFSPRPAR